MIRSNDGIDSRMPRLELLTEVVPTGGCFGHIPALPGLCFYAADPVELVRMAPNQIARYAEWHLPKDRSGLNPTATQLVHTILTGKIEDIRVIETERKEGSPLWISGNPAVLFDYDLHPLDDLDVKTHLRFTRQVLQQIQELSSTFSQTLRAWKPEPELRSIDEMLTHIGNCIWWYCSRIDDNLPEPEEPADETALERTGRLLDIAENYLNSVPFSERTAIHTPTRFHTNDPLERWTYTKVCRREAEHVWEHLSELIQRVRAMKEV